MIENEYTDGLLGSIRNDDGIWINTSCFQEEANHFRKKGYYCADPEMSSGWFDYWKEQRRRCIQGYSVGGAKITGDHYFYLNFAQIARVADPNARVVVKEVSFPDFWDGDYNYFWVREIARYGTLDGYYRGGVPEEFENLTETELQKKMLEIYNNLRLEVKLPPEALKGGLNLLVGKSRRKGYSYKNAAISANNFFTKPNSLTIFNAFDKKYLYPKGVFSMALEMITFINDNTAWTMPSDVVNTFKHIKASYITYKDGVKIEKGFKSEISAITCNNNPDPNRGKDAVDIFIEECGKFGTPGLLKKLYASSENCVKAGALKTGLITLFGTSGDMESGSVDFADMYTRPKAFDLLPFYNIWNPDMKESLRSFFHPANWNLEGYYDRQGNSDVEGAREAILKAREKRKQDGASTVEIQNKIQEEPLNGEEAFATNNASLFPIAELQAQLTKVIDNEWQEKKGIPVQFKREGKIVTATPILTGKAVPITSYKTLPKNLLGCPVIYEYPEEGAPRGTYKIGYDPVRQDTGTSLSAIIVYKSPTRQSYTHSNIVAEYIGRGDTSEYADAIAEYFADFYNTTIMYENEVVGTKNYFRRIKRLNLLAAQPDRVISKAIKGSTVARVYGCHMNASLRSQGEKYIQDWLIDVVDYDENGDPIRVLDRIYSRRLLEELISYNRKDNFDLISALIMCMFQVQESMSDDVQFETPAKTNGKELLEMMNTMYQKTTIF